MIWEFPIGACTAAANHAGLTPDAKDHAVGHGAVAGSFQEKPNLTFRHFVTRCLRERGLEVIGWQ